MDRLRPSPVLNAGAPLRRCARGVAAVEFALLLTLMVTIMGGIFAFGRTFWYYDALSKATRNAARTLSVSAAASIGTSGASAAKSEVAAAAASAGIANFSTANVIVKCLSATMIAADCADGTAPSGVRVSVTGYTLLLGSSMPFLPGSDTTFIVNLGPATTMPYMK